MIEFLLTFITVCALAGCIIVRTFSGDMVYLTLRGDLAGINYTGALTAGVLRGETAACMEIIY